MVRYIASDIDLYDICLLIEETRAPVDRLAQMLGTYDRKIERRKDRLREYGIQIVAEQVDHSSYETRLCDIGGNDITAAEALARFDHAKLARFGPDPSLLPQEEQTRIKDLYRAVLAGEQSWPDNFFDDSRLRRERLKVILPMCLNEVLGMKFQDVREKNLDQAHLSNVLDKFYRGSPYLMLREAYSWLREWHVGRVKGIWKGVEGKKRARAAVRWLIRDMLGYTWDELPAKISKKDFREHGLASLLTVMFRNSTYRAVNFAYPRRYSRRNFLSIKNKAIYDKYGNGRDKETQIVEEATFDYS